MEVNDLVIVTEEYDYLMRYVDPKHQIEHKVVTGNIGIIVQVFNDFVWVSFLNCAEQASQCHLRVIGVSTLEQFHGHKCTEWKSIVGDVDGMWAHKNMMKLLPDRLPLDGVIEQCK